MARTKEYNREVVLNNAMHLFWQQGYHNTSIQQLEAAMGINRYSIYDSFQDKHTLFLTALDDYLARVAGEWFSVLEEEGASLDAIARFFAQFLQLIDSDIAHWGCFACNAATELAQHDPAVAERSQQYIERITNGYRNVLENAIQKGELASTTDVAQVATNLAMATLGFFVYAKLPLSRAHFEQAVEGIVASVYKIV